MQRLSKKEIKAALDKMKGGESGLEVPSKALGKPSGQQANKNKLTKNGF